RLAGNAAPGRDGPFTIASFVRRGPEPAAPLQISVRANDERLRAMVRRSEATQGGHWAASLISAPSQVIRRNRRINSDVRAPALPDDAYPLATLAITPRENGARQARTSSAYTP